MIKYGKGSGARSMKQFEVILDTERITIDQSCVCKDVTVEKRNYIGLNVK